MNSIYDLIGKVSKLWKIHGSDIIAIAQDLEKLGVDIHTLFG
jgi:hypothetical protein